MTPSDYRGSITADIAPDEAFEKITRVSEWWGTQVEGQSRQMHDRFTVRFASGDSYTLQIAEVVANQRMVWAVIAARQDWVKDPREWVGTRIVWEISSQAQGTRIEMTHIGLVPDSECYERCSMAWDWLMESSLTRFLSDRTGLPVT